MEQLGWKKGVRTGAAAEQAGNDTRQRAAKCCRVTAASQLVHKPLDVLIAPIFQQNLGLTQPEHSRPHKLEDPQ